jgi:hypothetical protein
MATACRSPSSSPPPDFLRVAETAAPHLTGPDQGRWFARLDADQANLRRAAQHAACDPAGAALVLRFGVALRRYWLARSRGAEALGLLAPVLERPEAQKDPEDPGNPGLFGSALVAVTALAPFAAVAPARQYGERAVRLARRLRTIGCSSTPWPCWPALTSSLASLTADFRSDLRRSSEPGRSATISSWARP